MATDIRARTYTNKKEVTRVQVTIGIKEARALIAGDDDTFDFLVQQLSSISEVTAKKNSKAKKK